MFWSIEGTPPTHVKGAFEILKKKLSNLQEPLMPGMVKFEVSERGMDVAVARRALKELKKLDSINHSVIIMFHDNAGSYSLSRSMDTEHKLHNEFARKGYMICQLGDKILQGSEQETYDMFWPVIIWKMNSQDIYALNNHMGHMGVDSVALKGFIKHARASKEAISMARDIRKQDCLSWMKPLSVVAMIVLVVFAFVKFAPAATTEPEVISKVETTDSKIDPWNLFPMLGLVHLIYTEVHKTHE